MILPIRSLITGLFCLFAGALGLVRGSSSAAARLGTSPLIIGLTIVAFGTSSPELVVSLKAAWIQSSEITVGNVLGSNLGNIGLILGLAAVVQPLRIHLRVVQVQVPILIVVTVLASLFLWNQTLGRLEGFVLVVLLVIYIFYNIRQSRKTKSDSSFEEIKRLQSAWMDAGLILAGLVFLMLGAELLVSGAVSLAKGFGLSEKVIGISIVAVGTRLPGLFPENTFDRLKREYFILT
ncbi:hypothetical protein GF407_04310 [candidate division KSB1 bacterium]|nr:hypothetical protein [candidate division KSB1 bacterium]